MDLEAALRDQVKHAVGCVAPNAPVKKLKGDASSRQYFRVGAPPDSYVLMVMAPEASKKSEEATCGEIPEEQPFVNIHRYLANLGVRVPKILRYDEPAGMMVLEDLGDTTFEKALSPRTRDELYGRAIDLLAQLRATAEKAPDPECLAFGRSFNQDLYEWELHHFREWGLEVWSPKKPTPTERTRLDEIFRELSAELAAEPKGFTHRDYQSRNLMIKNEELVLIDFQDALQGPRQYDLVALLRDSYVELSWEFVDSMLDRYIESFERAGGARILRKPFKAFFDLLTVQRKLKDAGRFEYIHRVKGNSGFLVSIPASLHYVQNAFERLPRLVELQRILSRYVPQLG